jgi:hypothetical protein
VQFNLVLPWQKQRSLGRELFALANLVKFEEETSEMLHLEHSVLWCWNLDTLESRSELPWKFWNVVLEKDGENSCTDRVRNEEVWYIVKEERNTIHRVRRRKANLIGHILSGDCIVKHIIEGYEGCPKSKCTDFLFKCLFYSPEITSYLLQSVTLGKLQSGSVFSTAHSSTGSHFP